MNCRYLNLKKKKRYLTDGSDEAANQPDKK